MPMYVYRCERCGATAECLQKIGAPAPKECPACHSGGALRKQVTAAQFRLAGGGWYETDFKSASETRHNLAGAEPSGRPRPARRP